MEKKRFEIMAENLRHDAKYFEEYFNFFADLMNLNSPQILILQELMVAYHEYENTISEVYEYTLHELMMYSKEHSSDGDVNETS